MKISLQFYATPTSLLERRRPVLIGHEVGWASELLWKRGRTEKSVVLPTIESQFLGRSACNLVTVRTELAWVVTGFSVVLIKNVTLKINRGYSSF